MIQNAFGSALVFSLLRCLGGKAFAGERANADLMIPKAERSTLGVRALKGDGEAASRLVPPRR
jgi:hypothetical protein